MEKVIYYVRGLKPSNLKIVLEELRLMPPNVRSNLIIIRRIAAAEGRSSQALLEHAQPPTSIITMTTNKKLPTAMISDITDIPCTGSTLCRKQSPES